MIKVREISIRHMESKIRVYCDYEHDDSIRRLWYETDSDWSEYISEECGDAFFIILVLLAHYQGQDISFKTAISTRLYYGVTEVLLPGLQVIDPELPAIDIIADTKDFSFNPTAVGTALSLGVDSYHAVASSFNGPYPVTHLTLFNGGAFGDWGGNVSRSLFHKTTESVSKAAEEMGLPLITVDSNLSEIISKPFLNTHSIRNLSFALLFPSLFQKFYYASAYPASTFYLDKSLSDAAYYDLLTSKALCTESFEVMIAGLHDERIDKIATIASFEPSKHHLNVCVLADSNEFLDRSEDQVINCSKCFKCVKTMAAMDVIGVLDEYANVFDLDLYHMERSKHLGRIVYDAKKLKSSHAVEIIREGQKVPGFIPLKAYQYAFSRGRKNLILKLKHKLGSRSSY